MKYFLLVHPNIHPYLSLFWPPAEEPVKLKGALVDWGDGIQDLLAVTHM
jgi:hypothetical protein